MLRLERPRSVICDAPGVVGAMDAFRGGVLNESPDRSIGELEAATCSVAALVQPDQDQRAFRVLPTDKQAHAHSRFLAFFDECGDHSLAKIDRDFPVFVLALVVVERSLYRDQILPEFNRFKLDYFNQEGINLQRSS